MDHNIISLEGKPTLNFDVTTNTGSMFHGSTGFLYGVSETGVPSANVVEAIQPKILVQKAKDGKQHPSGDGYRLTSFLKECGVENIQIYLQDYYLEWPYELNGIDDYNEKVKKIVSEMVTGKTDEEIALYSFVIFNEPDQIWYGGNVEKMCIDWLLIYNTIKGIDSNIKVAGPNFAGYNSQAYGYFFQFASQNNCLPEYITWHELQKDKLLSFRGHYEEARLLIQTYYLDNGLEEPIIFINETVNFEDVGAPGPLVNWIAIFEESKVYASLPYWGLANSLNELAADSNKPNGAWWIYKWYAEMQGHTVELVKENIGDPGNFSCLYGLTSVDDENYTIKTLFGGQAGTQVIRINNIIETETFQNAKKAYVKIYRTKFTGHHGFADSISIEYEGNVELTDNNLVFAMEDAQLMDAFFAIITPATDIEEIKTTDWSQTYEAEDANLIGRATAYQKLDGSDLARSNRAEVGGLNSESDGVEFFVEVPEDGTYRLNIYYSVQAPQVDPFTLEYVESGGQNRAIGAIAKHSLSIDGEESQELIYDSTVKWGYYNYRTVMPNLSNGSHNIRIMHLGEDQNGKELDSILCALLDKIDLIYIPNDDLIEVSVDPEELTGSNLNYKFSQDEEGYQGAGYAIGSGDFIFFVNVPLDGYYRMDITGKGGNVVIAEKSLKYGADATAKAEVENKFIALNTTSLGLGFDKVNAGMFYLTAGINHMRISSDTEIALDKIVFTYDEIATKETEWILEAEETKLSGTDPHDGYDYLLGSSAVPAVIENEYASGGKAVEGFRGGLDNEITFNVTVQTTGSYKLSIFYANNEPAPVMKRQDGSNYIHPYNTDLVERYAQITVNDDTPQTVYFRNTLCWDVFRNVIIDVTLQEGENTIILSNDNSYKFSEIQDDFAPRFDKFIIAPAMYQDGVK